jgi:flavodoxin
MAIKKTIIVFESYHHKNTEKIARILTQALQAKLYRPEQINVSTLSDFDLIGFGTGIYHGKPHVKIRHFLEQLPLLKNKKAFLFTTSGFIKDEYTQKISDSISKKGLLLIGSFACKGHNTYGPFKVIGGLNRGHPDLEDFYNAEIFANDLENRL